MALDRSEIAIIRTGVPSLGDLAILKTSDNIATVEAGTGATYFNTGDGVADLMANGGFLLAQMGDGVRIYRWVVSAGVVTINLKFTPAAVT